MAKAPRFQYSVAALLLVTTVVALALGVASLLAIPLTHPAVYALLAVYLLLIGVWAIIRGPTALRNLGEFRRRKRELEIKRAALAEEVRRSKAAVQVANPARGGQNEEP